MTGFAYGTLVGGIMFGMWHAAQGRLTMAAVHGVLALAALAWLAGRKEA
jgi:hypothetical protein